MDWKRLAWVVLPGMLLVSAVSCSDDDDNGTQPPPAVDQFETVRSAADAYITSLGSAPTITAQQVFDDLDDNFELSVRSHDHYLLGHVRGARNIPYVKVADPATDLSILPKGQLMPVYCYTGHTAGLAATMLGMMGYNTKNMKFGMMAWTEDAAVRAQNPFMEANYPGYADVETTPNALTVDHGLPTLDVSSSSDAGAIVRAACDAYLNRFDGTGVSPVIEASALHARNFEDGDPDNDYFVLSVRSADHYALGHITGAYNIPWNQIAKAENLRKLPHDKKIVIYCYTGHTGAIAAGVLGALGYDVVNLKHGMMAWTKDEAVRVAQPFKEDVDCKKFTVVTGPDPE